MGKGGSMTAVLQPFLNARIDLDLAQLHLRHAADRIALAPLPSGEPKHFGPYGHLRDAETLLAFVRDQLTAIITGTTTDAAPDVECQSCGNAITFKTGMAICFECQYVDTAPQFAERQYAWEVERDEAARDWAEEHRWEAA